MTDKVRKCKQPRTANGHREWGGGKKISIAFDDMTFETVLRMSAENNVSFAEQARRLIRKATSHDRHA